MVFLRDVCRPVVLRMAPDNFGVFFSRWMSRLGRLFDGCLGDASWSGTWYIAQELFFFDRVFRASAWKLFLMVCVVRCDTPLDCGLARESWNAIVCCHRCLSSRENILTDSSTPRCAAGDACWWLLRCLELRAFLTDAVTPRCVLRIGARAGFGLKALRRNFRRRGVLLRT